MTRPRSYLCGVRSVSCRGALAVELRATLGELEAEVRGDPVRTLQLAILGRSARTALHLLASATRVPVTVQDVVEEFDSSGAVRRRTTRTRLSPHHWYIHRLTTSVNRGLAALRGGEAERAEEPSIDEMLDGVNE